MLNQHAYVVQFLHFTRLKVLHHSQLLNQVGKTQYYNHTETISHFMQFIEQA